MRKPPCKLERCHVLINNKEQNKVISSIKPAYSTSLTTNVTAHSKIVTVVYFLKINQLIVTFSVQSKCNRTFHWTFHVNVGLK